MDKRPPHLTVAASNDPAEVERAKALQYLAWPAQLMVANLFRVIRGAGRPYELPRQILELAVEIDRAGEHANGWYIGEALKDALQEALPLAVLEGDDLDLAEETILKGALQLMASSLLSQSAQTSRGRTELHDGIQEVLDVWEKNRRRVRRPPGPQPSQRSARKQPKTAASDTETPGQVENDKYQRPTSTAEFMRQRKRELDGLD